MKIKLNSWLTLSIHKAGLNIVAILLGLSLVSLALSGLHAVTLFLVILTFCSYWFFRDPERIIPQGENIIVSPADGIILDISSSILPSELNDTSNTIYNKISIFLRVSDVHIQRAPISSTIEKIEYVHGAFVNASFDKASTDNERNIVVFKPKKQIKNEILAVVQISGFIARRIVCDLKIGDEISMGDKYGIIKFGSRVEIYLPENYKIKILKGQTMVGGETIIAEVC